MQQTVSQSIERRWDAVERHVRHHRRKYAVVGFFVFFLPQWGPPAWEMSFWLASFLSVSEIHVRAPHVDLSFSWWNWVTAPLGVLLFLFVWWEVRKSPQRPVAVTPPASLHLEQMVEVARFVRETGAPFEMRVMTELVRNIGSGATPGMWIRATNLDPTTIRRAAYVLTNVLRWSESHQQFVETQEIHQNGPFRELETNRNDLFCGQPADLGFVRAEQYSLKIEGKRDGGQDDCRIRTAGVWQLVGRVVVDQGRYCDVLNCFQWEGKGIPTPCECPQPQPRVTAPGEPVAPARIMSGDYW